MEASCFSLVRCEQDMGNKFNYIVYCNVLLNSSIFFISIAQLHGLTYLLTRSTSVFLFLKSRAFRQTDKLGTSKIFWVVHSWNMLGIPHCLHPFCCFPLKEFTWDLPWTKNNSLKQGIWWTFPRYSRCLLTFHLHPFLWQNLLNFGGKTGYEIIAPIWLAWKKFWNIFIFGGNTFLHISVVSLLWGWEPGICLAILLNLAKVSSER